MKFPTELNLTTFRMMAALPGGRARLVAMHGELTRTRVLIEEEAKKQLDICDQHLKNMDAALGAKK